MMDSALRRLFRSVSEYRTGSAACTSAGFLSVPFPSALTLEGGVPPTLPSYSPPLKSSFAPLPEPSSSPLCLVHARMLPESGTSHAPQQATLAAMPDEILLKVRWGWAFRQCSDTL